MAGRDRNPYVQNAHKSTREAKKSLEFDLQRRLQDQHQILSADDMAGLYDPKRGLFTTIDGKPRALTVDDLAAFRAAVHDIERRHGQRRGNIPSPDAGGIKPKQVIDLAAPEDRQRASQQIHTVIPVSNRAGVVHIQTNAGKSSKVSRHHVYVQFLGYNNALASSAKSLDAARAMLSGKIKFDCDCARHTFWYRYIATIGNFNYGRPEDGFPKVRNPNLRGLACKHVIRVMAHIASGGTFNLFAARMIETGRRTLSDKLNIVKVGDQQAFIEQAEKLRKASKRGSTITTTAQRREKREAQPAVQRRRAEQARVKAANEKLRKSRPEKVNKPVSDAALVSALKRAGYGDKAIAAAIAAAKQAQE